jgi:predicted GNAT superfamily acetyltransferase
MKDDLNQGMPSDRFAVEWWIKEEPAARPSKYEIEGSLLINTDRYDNGDLVPAEIELKKDSADGYLFVPVPSNFQTLKKNSSELALSWRMSTRKVFAHYFTKGWEAIDLFRNKSESDLCYYVLKK